ncbi:unnamed protein product [Owenia fusiformis]|uniref:Hexosyltransferase n=1 Tax=Owenia fusiformis TaxID=6347 RepID=A0A8S4NQM1_OWEFU|nr:unnamed protein product [Owenia fusiformis]
MLPRITTVYKYGFCATLGFLIIMIYMSQSRHSRTAKRPFDRLGREMEIPVKSNRHYLQVEQKRSAEFQAFKTKTNENKIIKSEFPISSTQKIISPHNFDYIINEEKLCDNETFLLIYVHTAPGHVRHRNVIRDTWGNANNIKDISIKLIFLLGNASTRKLNDAIKFESEHYHDIIQEDFVDSYRNLTYKGIMGLKWVTNYCKTAKFILKTDDDIFVNIFILIKHLKARLEHDIGTSNLILCHIWFRMHVVRDKRSKWYISEAEYEPNVFPPYCSGAAFVLSADAPKAMYKRSLYEPFFWVDDYFISGLLATKAGLVREKFNRQYSISPMQFIEKFLHPISLEQQLIFGQAVNINQILRVWKKVLEFMKTLNKNTEHSRGKLIDDNRTI